MRKVRLFAGHITDREILAWIGEGPTDGSEPQPVVIG